jgi:threonine/homoserine/homoserine lactone efflux protein
MAIGITSSDILYIVITYSGLSFISGSESIKYFLGIMGAIIMVTFGVFNIVRPIPQKGQEINDALKNNDARSYIKGFILNAMNPFVFIFWIGIASFVTVEMHFSLDQAWLFYAGVVTVVLVTDLIKSYLAGKFRSLITERFTRVMNRGVGIGFILFGLRLFYFTIQIIPQ